jgi:REP element-mobilizing transposase RayT
MSRPLRIEYKDAWLRIEYKDAWYHAMNRGQNREVIFHDKYDYRMFVELLKETSEMWNFHISAYCLMPNHYHLLIQTPDANLSRGMRHINGLYTQRYNRRHGCDGPLFKGRYKSVLVGGDDYLLQALRYIHKNPVKAGIVDAPAKYTWSSHKGYLSAAEKWNWLYKTTLLSMLSPNRKNWLKMYKNFMRDKSDVFYSEMIERKRWPVCYGISEFVDWIKGSYYARKIDDDIPQSKELAPDETLIIKCVCEYYKVTNDTLMKSKRGEFNEPRNIAIYLFRTLRHDSLKIIGESFNIRKYYTVSSVISRLKQLLKKDKIIKKRIESVKDLINKYQEQT